MTMRVTLNGFIQWNNPNIFEDVVLPSGIDKDVLIKTIIRKCGDMYTYHQDPNFLKEEITDWFNVAMYENFKRMYEAITATYDPIHNFSRTKHDFEQNYGKVHSEAEGETHQGTSQENYVNSYDSATYKKDSKQEGKENASSSNEVDTNTSDALTVDSTESGNIGNLKTSELIEAELSLRRYNLYNQIASMFEDEFLVRIY